MDGRCRERRGRKEGWMEDEETRRRRWKGVRMEEVDKMEDGMDKWKMINGRCREEEGRREDGCMM